MRIKRKYKILLLIAIFASIAFSGYCAYLAVKIHYRFSGRKWSIPSKVYSDITLLFPGQGIIKDIFYKKLGKLGYQRVVFRPKQKGQVEIMDSGVFIYLKDLNTPSQKREGFLAYIQIKDHFITAIKNITTDTDIPLLTLEPEEIMLFFGSNREKRRLISIDQAPQNLIHAILTTEDSRFFEHHGFDLKGILRAFYTNIRYGRISQGGSTITQQLAKNYFLTSKRTISRKIKELIMAVLIEAMYDKREILEIYLNEIYFGQRGSISINGVGEASFFYFGKPVTELSLGSCAVLAAMIKGPNLYSPYRNMQRCLERRNFVLKSMQKKGWIDEKQCQDAIKADIKVIGYNKYERTAPYFVDYLADQLEVLYPKQALSSLGLNIYTTLDTQVQMAAEMALEHGLARLGSSKTGADANSSGNKPEGAIIVMQPKTGYILAMAGGRNYQTSQFNRITQARRQPGSTFKPFVFYCGLEKFNPGSLLSNQPKIYQIGDQQWEPQNIGNEDEPIVTFRTALAKSINRATVDLAMQIGLENIIDKVKRFEFSTPIKPYPSLALGAFEMIPIELARAYCAFAADGVLPYPLSLKSVIDEDGSTLERKHMRISPIMTQAEAYVMDSLLRSVVEEGTAQRLKGMGIDFPVAGKTGTSNDYKDAWFIGFTPDILALVWVGYDDGRSIKATGSGAALPIWAELLKNMPQYVSGRWFKMPKGVVKHVICSESGFLANENCCPDPVEEVFLEGHEPTQSCPLHKCNNPIKGMIHGIKKFIDQF